MRSTFSDQTSSMASSPRLWFRPGTGRRHARSVSSPWSAARSHRHSSSVGSNWPNKWPNPTMAIPSRAAYSSGVPRALEDWSKPGPGRELIAVGQNDGLMAHAALSGHGRPKRSCRALSENPEPLLAALARATTAARDAGVPVIYVRWGSAPARRGQRVGTEPSQRPSAWVAGPGRPGHPDPPGRGPRARGHRGDQEARQCVRRQ